MRTFNITKDKSDVEEVAFDCAGDWPLQSEEDGTITCLGIPHFPLVHECKCFSRGSFNIWLSNIGGPDGLPELTKAHLRSFLTVSTEIHCESNIGHFLTDVRAANPSFVLQKYFRYAHCHCE